MYMKLIVKPLVIVAVLLALTACHAQDDGKVTNQATLDSLFDTVAIIGVENETYLETNKVFKNNDGSRRIQNITVRCAIDDRHIPVLSGVIPFMTRTTDYPVYFITGTIP